MPKIYLYAEILIHIRQLTLQASFQTEKREGTKLDVTTDKRVISVTHDGETQRLYLPTQIKGDATVTFPLLKTTDISARLQIEDEHEWKCMINNEIEAPWMAADLSSATAIQCRHCKAYILRSGKVHQWKDLPSENWAELMDFWFCHKPHGDEQSTVPETAAAAAAKGFSSTSKLAVTSGTGMTDLVSIVLCADDCTNTKAAEKQARPGVIVLRCSKCLEILGTANEDENLVRLHKSTISLTASDNSATWISYPSSLFTCVQILALIEATALKKFVVHSTEAENALTGERLQSNPLILWVFNPDIYYSCSAYESNGILSNDATTISAGNLDANDNIAENATTAPDQTPPQANTIDSPLVNQSMQDKQPNPNNDETSQIYGEATRPQFVSGDLEIEIPVPAREESVGQASSAHSHIPIGAMLDTETSLGADRHTQDSTTREDNTSASQTSPPHKNAHKEPNTTADEHINLVHRAAKVFYKPLPSDTTPAGFLDQPANASSYEELYLSNPSDLIELRTALEKSTSMLPASARTFQDWNVGLLNRYEKVPSGLGVMAENPLARGIRAKDGRVTRWDLGHGAEGLYA